MATPTPPTREQATAERHRLAGELMQSLADYREAKRRFAAITAAYQRQDRSSTDAEYAAASDPRRRQASADAAWYREEAQLAASAMQALLPYAHPEC